MRRRRRRRIEQGGRRGGMDLRRAQSIAAGAKCSRAKKVKELRDRREVRRLTCMYAQRWRVGGEPEESIGWRVGEQGL